MDDLVLPDYGGPCITNIVPALLGPPDELPPWVPPLLADADQVVLFVVDGLGWEQLQARLAIVPTLATMEGGSITTVAPSTTATALTSLTTGLPPGRHGVVGYRIAVHGEVLNVLRWSTAAGDARQSIPPAKFQPTAPFLGERPPVVTRAEYRTSGFTGAHLDPARYWGYRTLVDDGHRGRPPAAGVRAVRLRVLRRARQGGPRVRAGRALRRRADVDRPHDRPAARRAAPAGGARRHRRPRPGRRRRQRGRAALRRPEPVLDAVGRGPVPLAARPRRPGCSTVRRRPRRARG